MQFPAATSNAATLPRNLWGPAMVTVAVLSTWLQSTPFAAIATLAALALPRRDALILAGVSWFATQAIGFGLLHYPLTWSCVAGGINLGLCILATTGAAMLMHRTLLRSGWALAVVGTFVAAFLTYQAAMYVIAAWGGFDCAVSVGNALQMLYSNALALVGLLLLQAFANGLGYLRTRPSAARAMSAAT